MRVLNKDTQVQLTLYPTCNITSYTSFGRLPSSQFRKGLATRPPFAWMLKSSRKIRQSLKIIYENEQTSFWTIIKCKKVDKLKQKLNVYIPVGLI